MRKSVSKNTACCLFCKLTPCSPLCANWPRLLGSPLEKLNFTTEVILTFTVTHTIGSRLDWSVISCPWDWDIYPQNYGLTVIFPSFSVDVRLSIRIGRRCRQSSVPLWCSKLCQMDELGGCFFLDDRLVSGLFTQCALGCRLEPFISPVFIYLYTYNLFCFYVLTDFILLNIFFLYTGRRAIFPYIYSPRKFFISKKIPRGLWKPIFPVIFSYIFLCLYFSAF